LKIGRAVAAGVGLSIGFVVAYSLIFGVRFEDLASISLTTLIAASTLIFLRLLIQGIRFYLLTCVLNVRAGIASSVVARVSSEFVSLSTPTFIGGEAVRLAWLKARGADLGQATWIIFWEIYLDVVSTALVVYASASYLLLCGEYLLASLAALISTTTTAFFTFIYLFSKKSVLHIPKWLQKIVRFFFGESRGGRVITSLNQNLLSYHSSAINMNIIYTYKRTIGILLCTALMILLSGAVTQLVIGGSLSLRGLLLSTSGFHISLVIGTLPITIGGSGVSELVLNHFATNVFGSSNWVRVIAWRIITYHIPLTISGLALAVLSYKEFVARKIRSHTLKLG
jgi:uncharacterized membrane protein YbhN (UPF0104 family)